ncbi:hypothetical protein [Hespellia stercorisuis]|uniref:Uncharacterized protein n=1 Tax=Hespellia stercorisuis DSM 15480 TaxID=1121950 RepID=A0A1M6REZ2_9FIRM|nr:hypothetical protein [Hespellia stercorisuis]SHK30948.1 hypothetical protein SAMN02745243_02671 [Hespellia stercorisuis DSM 15480]
MEKVRALWINSSDPRGAVGIVRTTDSETKRSDYYIGIGMEGNLNAMVDIGYIVATGQKYPSLDHIVKFQNEEQADDESPMDKITAKAMEILCDKYCKYPCTVNDQEEMEEICDNCRVGKLIGIDAVNEYDRLNTFDQTQSAKLLEKFSNYQDMDCTGCIHTGNKQFCLNCYRGGCRDYYLEEEKNE